MSTEARIYVACLASYNSGKLHGTWIDVVDVEAMQEEIHAVLASSPEPNVTRRDAKCPDCGTVAHIDVYGDTGPGDCDAPLCSTKPARVWDGEPYPSSEEWAVHDFEGFGSINIGEHPDLQNLVDLAEAIDKHGDPFLAYLNNLGGLPELYMAIENFKEAYRGTYKSAADYAEERTEDMGAIPEHLKFYIDYAKMAEAWRMSGDLTIIEGDGGEVHIFDGTV